MGNYKIVASDLDGTLLNKAGKISPENLAAIGEMAERGIWFVPASGRGLSEMPEQYREEFISFVNDENGDPIYENTYQYAILKKEWDKRSK